MGERSRLISIISHKPYLRLPFNAQSLDTSRGRTNPDGVREFELSCYLLSWSLRWRPSLLCRFLLGECGTCTAPQQIAQQIQKFDQATSKSKLLGKTPEEIVSLLGKPAVDRRTPDNGNGTQGSFDMLYEGPFLSWGVPDRRMCYITFDNGRVSEVRHSSNGQDDEAER